MGRVADGEPLGAGSLALPLGNIHGSSIQYETKPDLLGPARLLAPLIDDAGPGTSGRNRVPATGVWSV